MSLPLKYDAYEPWYALMKQPNKVTETEHRRDEALRRALNTPPKQHKDMKKGKKRQDKPTASEKRT